MKILLVGDTHGDLGHARFAIDAAVRQDISVIFQLGDFGYWEHHPSGVEYLNRLDDYAYKRNVMVYFLDGNHDKTSLLLGTYRNKTLEGFIKVRNFIRYAPRGHRWTWDGCRFIALGGAYSVDKDWRLAKERARNKPESLWFPEEEMSDNDMDTIILNDSSPVDVILAHDKPRCAKPDWDRKDFPECWPNQDRLQRAVATLTPTEFFHGHLHYRYDQIVPYGALDGTTRELHVTGLAPNREANEFPGYTLADSWLVFDTKGVADEVDNSDQ